MTAAGAILEPSTAPQPTTMNNGSKKIDSLSPEEESNMSRNILALLQGSGIMTDSCNRDGSNLQGSLNVGGHGPKTHDEFSQILSSASMIGGGATAACSNNMSQLGALPTIGMGMEGPMAMGIGGLPSLQPNLMGLTNAQLSAKAGSSHQQDNNKQLKNDLLFGATQQQPMSLHQLAHLQQGLSIPQNVARKANTASAAASFPPFQPTASRAKAQAATATCETAAAPVDAKLSCEINNNDDDDEKSGERFKPFHEERWTQRLDELRAYAKKHGHCLVPHAYTEHPQLARWVKRQRRQYKLMLDGRPSTMTPDRVRVLEEAGFVWDSHGTTWREKIEELRAYRRRFGHCAVPSNYAPNKQLATWVKCQRRQHKLMTEGRKSSMTKERAEELEREGFQWEVRPSSAAGAATASPPGASTSVRARSQPRATMPTEGSASGASSSSTALAAASETQRLLAQTSDFINSSGPGPLTSSSALAPNLQRIGSMIQISSAVEEQQQPLPPQQQGSSGPAASQEDDKEFFDLLCNAMSMV